MSINSFESDFHVESRIGKTSCNVVLDRSLLGLTVVLEEKYAVVLSW